MMDYAMDLKTMAIQHWFDILLNSWVVEKIYQFSSKCSQERWKKAEKAAPTLNIRSTTALVKLGIG